MPQVKEDILTAYYDCCDRIEENKKLLEQDGKHNKKLEKQIQKDEQKAKELAKKLGLE